MQFICDYCGSLVSMKDKTCPTCKAIFAQIRCPQCTFVGTSDVFKNGCPSCHYQDVIAENKKVPDELPDKQKVNRTTRFWIYLLVLFLINVVLFIYVGNQ